MVALLNLEVSVCRHHSTRPGICFPTQRHVSGIPRGDEGRAALRIGDALQIGAPAGVDPADGPGIAIAFQTTGPVCILDDEGHRVTVRILKGNPHMQVARRIGQSDRWQRDETEQEPPDERTVSQCHPPAGLRDGDRITRICLVLTARRRTPHRALRKTIRRRSLSLDRLREAQGFDLDALVRRVGAADVNDCSQRRAVVRSAGDRIRRAC